MVTSFTESGIHQNSIGEGAKDGDRQLHVKQIFAGNDPQAMQRNRPDLTGKTISDFIDMKSGRTRSHGAIAGRLVEEVVELALACGVSTQDIMGHINDATFNQCVKAGRASGKTIFPSTLTDTDPDVPGEIADVSIILKDLAHCCQVNIPTEEHIKWDKFIQKDFHVSDNGTLYAVKPHIQK